MPVAAVERLPRGELGVPELDDDPFWRLAAACLVECRRAQTRRAYFNDLRPWSAWCSGRQLHPLQARRHDLALWARQLAERPARCGKVEAPVSIARRLSCLSTSYRYGVEVDVLEENPVANVKRPRVPNESMTVGLARDELEHLRPARRARPPDQAPGLGFVHASGAIVEEPRAVGAGDEVGVQGAFDGRGERLKRVAAALAGEAQDAVAELVAEVGDVA